MAMNVDLHSSTSLIDVTSPEDAFCKLWSEALHKCEQKMTSDSTGWQLLLQRVERCRKVEDVCLVLDDIMQRFERFRGGDTTWGKLRNKYVKPAIEVLLLFNDAVAETAASFPRVPGGKAVFAVFGVLLQATKGVSAYCEALIVLFEELNVCLESLRHRLHAPSSLGPASKTVAIAILAHLLEILTRTAGLLSKRPWLGRLALYGKVLIKDAAIQGELQRLRDLTNLEVRAIISEIRVDASETRDLGLRSVEFTRELLSEFRTLNNRQAQMNNTAGGLIGRGMNKLLQGQKELIAFLRAEREDRDQFDASRIFEKLNRVDRADIDAQCVEGCMKGTRVQILRDLRAWSHERDAPRIYWLNGMAGTGKSAIARSFCHLLQRDKLLGGSFFCSRGGSVEEGDTQRIIPTLAASLSAHSAAFNKSLLAELHKEPFSIHSNLALQIERLMRRPLSVLDDGSRMLVLVVDALDECSDEDSIYNLLSILLRISGILPIKFFLTSRPEPHIRQQLEAVDPSLGKVLRLHDIEQNIVKADISLYLAQGLRAMREPSFPSKWPQKADIATLTRLSGKLFIYAFTALQYLRRDPIGRLPKLTGTTVTAGRPLTQPLDNIYSLILTEAMDPGEYEAEEIDSTLRMISAIVSVREPMNVNHLGRLLGMTASRLRASLNRLYAVIYIPVRDDSGVLSTFHASFSEFFITPGRAPEHMHRYLSDSHGLLAIACIKTLRSDELHFNMSQAKSSHLPNTAQICARIDAPLRYACLYWSHHVAAATETTVISHMFSQVFIGPKFLFWLEALSTMGFAEKAIDILGLAQNMGGEGYALARFIEAAIDFAEEFSPAFAHSAPHVYISALSLCNVSSIIGQRCFPSFLGIPRLTFSNDDTGKSYGSVLCAAYTSDGTGITVATEGGVNVYRGLHDWRVPAHISTVQNGRYVAFSKSGSRFAYVFDEKIICFSMEGGSLCTLKLDGDSSSMEFVVFSEDGKRLASGSSDTSIVVWDTERGECLTRREVSTRTSNNGGDHLLDVTQKFRAALSHNGKLVAYVDRSTGGLVLFDVESQRYRTFASTPRGKIGSVTCVEFTPDYSCVLSRSCDGAICFWGVESGTTMSHFMAHSTAITAFTFSSDGNRLLSGSLDGNICIWKIENGILTTGQPIRQIEVFQPIRALSFSPDGETILCTTYYGAVQVWHIDPTHVPSRPREDGLDGLHLSDDGWIRGPDNELVLWVNRRQRKKLTPQQCSLVIYSGRLNIKWTSAIGTNWARCYTAISEKGSVSTMGRNGVNSVRNQRPEQSRVSSKHRPAVTAPAIAR